MRDIVKIRTRNAPDGNTKELQGQSAYVRLLDEIRSGALPPGVRLTETEIAQRLDVSRTPVREAIHRLEADGLVEHLPRAGAVVRQLGYSEIMELYEMRVVLECTAARLAARGASDMEIDELDTINAEMETATRDGAAAFELNRQFHAVLVDAARNRYLLKSVNAIHTTLLILGPSTLTDSVRAEQAAGEHRAVVAALRARDGASAEQLMRSHMELSQRARLRTLRQRGQLPDVIGETTQ